MNYYLTWFFIAALYSPVFYDLYRSRWETIDYTHAYFILPVSLWVVWQKRNLLKELFMKTSLRPLDWVSLTAVVLGLLMFVFGWRQAYLFIATLSLILVLWGAARFLYGPAVVKALRFPILYLFFLIPPPLGVLDGITLPMRYGISQVTEMILSILNYPIERSGLLLTMDGKEIFMGAPCSGFRSLITMFALAVAYVNLTNSNALKKIILIPSVVPLALIGNVIRVLTLCLVTYYLGHEAAEGFFHDFSGGLIFLILIVGLLGLEFIIDKTQKKGRVT